MSAYLEGGIEELKYTESIANIEPTAYFFFLGLFSLNLCFEADQWACRNDLLLLVVLKLS